MTSEPIQQQTIRVNFFVLLSVPIALTLFLFFIDEGYYNFEWMQKSSNWFAFFLYVSAMILSQFLVRYFIFRKKEGIKFDWLSCLIGIPSGLIILFLWLSH